MRILDDAMMMFNEIANTADANIAEICGGVCA